MKFTIKQNILMDNLNNVIKGVSTKDMIPILKCIKFELKEEGLYLLSTNNELSIKVFIPVDKIESIDEIGVFVAPGKSIYECIRKITDDITDDLINIEYIADSKLKIYNNNSKFDILCNVVSEFPDLEFDDGENPLLMPKKLFKTILNQTMFATAIEEKRRELTGLNIKIEKDIMECTATDSYRLAQKKIKLDKTFEEKVNMIVPAVNLNELGKMINDDDDNIEIHIFESKILFKLQNIYVMSRIINGTYPDVSKLIPNEFDITLKVNTSDFYKAVDKVSLFTNESEKFAIRLETKEKNVRLYSNLPEKGEGEANILGEKEEKKDIKISFSAKYMLEAVKSLESPEVLLLFNGDAKPIIIQGSENDNLKQLIVPIRTY